MNIITFLGELGKIITLVGIQYLLGRRGAFPYGLLTKFSLLKISIIVTIADVILILFLLNFFDYFARLLNKMKWLKKSVKKKENKSVKLVEGRFKKFVNLGVFLVSAFPFGGGAITGSILAISLKINKKKAFLIVFCGDTCITILYYLFFAGILELKFFR